MPLTQRSGVLLMLISALVFSTAGIFTKGVAADAWSVIFWRGLFAALFTGVYVQWNRKFYQEFRSGTKVRFSLDAQRLDLICLDLLR